MKYEHPTPPWLCFHYSSQSANHSITPAFVKESIEQLLLIEHIRPIAAHIHPTNVPIAQAVLQEYKIPIDSCVDVPLSEIAFIP